MIWNWLACSRSVLMPLLKLSQNFIEMGLFCRGQLFLAHRSHSFYIVDDRYYTVWGIYSCTLAGRTPTNTIEAVHRQFRKLTKTKGAFPNKESLLKLLYLGINNASKKWTMPIQNWSLTISQLAIFFEGRLDNELKI